MKIEQVKKFVLSGVYPGKILLVPAEKTAATVRISSEFIHFYQAMNLQRIALEQGGEEIKLTLALCNTDKNESWMEASKDLQNDGWSGASLSMWQLYIKDGKSAPLCSVVLTGMRYRDDDFVEWVPLVHYQPRTFLRDVTEVSMKRSCSLSLKEARCVLISKTEILKT